ncbi:hypothetical protein [Rhodococcus jostii]|uniref:Transposase n=1 Tax=Rhodococcus jostii TaxID=132919 RepID=A0ABU4CUJ1_RHOJO|nr:hypothetical protein [Rhodococcus jostii]MDV6286762.1 hypothetical protein [Rhodococcus jostii]
MRWKDLDRLIGTCAGHGRAVGIYAQRLLDDRLPWTRMRAVYRLLGLVRRYGSLVSLRFAEAGHSVLVLIPVGVGKTRLATALGHVAIP